MKVVKTIQEVRTEVRGWKAQGLSIGYVPTMGYLHEGHASLIKAARENDRIVVSIFVNPMQFGPSEDLDSYPRDLAKDSKLCEELGTNLIFAPEPEEMYTNHFNSYADVNVLTNELCGLTRPVHFRGVCTVLTKFFNIVQPDCAYFGQKDAQQVAVVRRMVEDFNIPLKIVSCPIIREADGLAKSSRNTYLSAEERQAALCLSQAISIGQNLVNQGETSSEVVIQAMKEHINKEPLARIDYVKAVDGLSMQQVPLIEEVGLVAMAVYIGKIRLIDNFIIE